MSAKDYKKTLHDSYNKFKENFNKELRNTSKFDSRKFWNILNKYSGVDKSKSNPISLDELYQFFKNVNSGAAVDDDEDFADVDISINESILEQLNENITESEIRKVVKNLSRNKAGGYDKILNEYIKSTLDDCIFVYVKLFNLIYDSGYIPESWTVGIIKPLYKNKGDPKNPENYRPITLISCLGKVFTAVLNNRLCLISDEFKILNDSQSGFRRGYSTCDNIFIYQSI